MSKAVIEFQREQVKREMEEKAKKAWHVTYKDEPWSSIVQGKQSEGIGFYEITFKGLRYGFISKEAWDTQSTRDILHLVEKMLNDAHDLALRRHD
jgi:hypothetical protein